MHYKVTVFEPPLKMQKIVPHQRLYILAGLAIPAAIFVMAIFHVSI